MGCGGSKHDVATGNTTTSRGGLRKKPSDASHYASAASTDTSGNLQVAPRTPAADVKDITVSGVDGAGEGKLLTSRSPDRYFSSRKDDETADAAAAAGAEYYSPRYVPDGDQLQAAAKEFTDLATKGAAGSTAADAAVTTAAAADGGQALGGAALKEVQGMLNGELPGDLKEPILVEETKFEVTA